MKKIIYGITLIFVMAFCLHGCSVVFNFPKSGKALLPKTDESVTQDQPEITAYLLEPGEVFEHGGYIELENVQIQYDGYYKGEHDVISSEHFIIENNGEKDVRLSFYIVGVKKDGSHETLYVGGLDGIDWDRYNEDLQENGWAIYHNTNLVKSGSKLEAAVAIMDFGNDFDMDVDGDGYYDVVFPVFPQDKPGGFVLSTNSPESEIYKLKAK